MEGVELLETLCSIRAASGDERKMKAFLLDHILRNQDNWKNKPEIFHGDDPSQPAGMVVLSAQSVFDPSHIDLQIECKLEALEHGEIRLGSIDGPVLKMDLLPYPLIEI